MWAVIRRWLGSRGATIVAAPGQQAVAVGGNVVNSNIFIGSITAEALAALQRRAPRLCTLPRSIADFTGREAELARLDELLSSGGRASISALTGMGGVGKTALAVVAAWRSIDHFSDGALFIDLGGFGPNPLSPEAALSALIAQVGPQAKPPEGRAAMAAAWRGLVAGRRLLLVLDNAKDLAQVRDLVLPEPVALLVTSRVPIPLQGVEAIRLDALGEAEAVTLLRTSLAQQIGDANLAQVAAACARLPIALRAAAAFLAEHPGWTVEEYLTALAKQRLPYMASENDERLDVAAVLGFSIARLTEVRPELAARWRLLVLFPSGFDAAGAAAVWAIEQDEARDDLDRLVTRSLVEHDAASRRYRLHDLYRELAGQDPNEQALEEARKRHAAYYCAVVDQANKIYLKGSTNIQVAVAIFDLEWINIQSGQQWAAEQILSRIDAAEIARSFVAIGEDLLNLRRRPSERICWFQAGIDACSRLGDRAGEANAFRGLGIAWRYLSDYNRAILYYNCALEIFRDIGDRYSEGVLLNNIANSMVELGKTEGAIDKYKEYYRICLEQMDRRGQGKALGNIGHLFYKMKDYRRAIRFQLRRLAIARNDGDRRAEGYALGNLGLAWTAFGKPGNAIAFHENALAISREIGDRRGEGQDLGDLGLAWAALGEYLKALNFHEQHLAIAREIGEVAAEANSLWNCAGCLEKLGEHQYANQTASAALTIYHQLGHPNVGSVESWLRERGIDPDQL